MLILQHGCSISGVLYSHLQACRVCGGLKGCTANVKTKGLNLYLVERSFLVEPIYVAVYVFLLCSLEMFILYLTGMNDKQTPAVSID